MIRATANTRANSNANAVHGRHESKGFGNGVEQVHAVKRLVITEQPAVRVMLKIFGRTDCALADRLAGKLQSCCGWVVSLSR